MLRMIRRAFFKLCGAATLGALLPKAKPKEPQQFSMREFASEVLGNGNVEVWCGELVGFSSIWWVSYQKNGEWTYEKIVKRQAEVRHPSGIVYVVDIPEVMHGLSPTIRLPRKACVVSVRDKDKTYHTLTQIEDVDTKWLADGSVQCTVQDVSLS